MRLMAVVEPPQAAERLGAALAGSAAMKTSRGMLFAGLVCAALTLAPVAVFAQHGGGAGGGGGHAGGGGGGFGGGGGHFGGGSARPSSAPAAAGHGSTSASGASNTANSTGGGHWWNPFHGSANANEKTPAQLATHNVVGANSVSTVHPAVGRIFSPTRPGTGYYPYYPYYPYYYPYYGYGLFWGSAFGPCDPFWGCNGFGYGFGGYGFGLGYGYGGGYGYYGGGLFGTGGSGDQPGWTYSSNNGGDSSGDYTVSAQGSGGDANISTSDTGEATPSLGTSEPTTVLRNDAAPAAAAKPNTVLYMKDGSSFAVSDYWLSEGRLHYVTSYGGENAMDLSKLDLQKTVDENGKAGNSFSLKATPDAQK
jgi:hypothetical protein